MRLIELNYQVDLDGSLTLPAADLAEIGILPFAPVTVAYLSTDRIQNSFSEFLVVGPDDGTNLQQIAIPSTLMEHAGIPPDSDIEIACANGAIVLYHSPTLSVEELTAVLDKLHIAGDTLAALMQENNGSSDGI